MSFMTRAAARTALAWALATMLPAGASWAQVQPLTLAEALEKARASSPAVQIANAEIDAARGRVAQADTGLNPEASYEVENFGGNGGLRGLDNAESTFGLSQVIELGGKQSARRDAAAKLADAVVVRSWIARADLDLAVRERFAELAAAEDRAELAEAASKRADRLVAIAQKLVDAGREPPLRLLRAQAAAAEASADLVIANVERSAARRALVALWGDSESAVDATGPWEFGALTAISADQSLDYLLAAADHTAAESAVRLEQANAWIDVTVDAGIRRFEATDEQAFVAGIRIPIPIQNNNAGAIAAARADDRAAKIRLNVALADATRRINDARSAFDAAEARLAALESGAVRQAEEALNLAQVGYEAGRFQLIDVLDAEDAFAGIRSALIDAKLARARAAAALLRANAHQGAVQ